jgi:hypothetical protein
MLKTISGALLAVSLVAAPVLAADTTTQAPASKTAQKTTQAPSAKTEQAKPSDVNANAKNANAKNANAKNANAKMSGHKHYRHRGHHKNMSAIKTHSKVSSKQAAPAPKRS